eukprot:snap_masked-scaffold_8-processed-gene-7.27-mRNA-1 protein AED:1.00 eAED:1.00 QI:0/0/0/0/1/1/2/0/91
MAEGYIVVPSELTGGRIHLKAFVITFEVFLKKQHLSLSTNNSGSTVFYSVFTDINSGEVYIVRLIRGRPQKIFISLKYHVNQKFYCSLYFS